MECFCRLHGNLAADPGQFQQFFRPVRIFFGSHKLGYEMFIFCCLAVFRKDLVPFYRGFLERGVNIVPSNWPVAPGWGTIEAYYNSNGIDGKILRGELTAADVAAELQAVADQGVADHLKVLLGE